MDKPKRHLISLAVNNPNHLYLSSNDALRHSRSNPRLNSHLPLRRHSRTHPGRSRQIQLLRLLSVTFTIAISCYIIAFIPTIITTPFCLSASTIRSILSLASSSNNCIIRGLLLTLQNKRVLLTHQSIVIHIKQIRVIRSK